MKAFFQKYKNPLIVAAIIGLGIGFYFGRKAAVHEFAIDQCLDVGGSRNQEKNICEK